MVTSATNDRVRIRHVLLRSTSFAREISGRLLETKGVIEVHINRRVGSLLVLYDKAKISARIILNKIAEILNIDEAIVSKRIAHMDRVLSGVRGRRYVKRGMLAGLATAMTLLVYSEKLHMASGSVFLGLLGLHFYQNRRTLMR